MTRRQFENTESNSAEEETVRLTTENNDESKQSIEEAAYYIGMNRRQYSHPGDELNDWFEAERAVKGNLD